MKENKNDHNAESEEESSSFSTVDEHDEDVLVVDLNFDSGSTGRECRQQTNEKKIIDESTTGRNKVSPSNTGERCYVDSSSSSSALDDDDKSTKATVSKATVQDLQKRLENRNLLLEIVRKAYHRDVLVVKHHLLQQQETMQQQEKTSTAKRDDPLAPDYKSTSQTKSSLNASSIASLSSVPSIDLRHKGLHLFSPQECELRLRPCPTCGGQYEVVHRESSRYSALLTYKDQLLATIRSLEEDVSDVYMQMKYNFLISSRRTLHLMVRILLKRFLTHTKESEMERKN